jgi:hypothetical protein
MAAQTTGGISGGNLISGLAGVKRPNYAGNNGVLRAGAEES